MSDPVSNHDIEDVLASIRRLVAQGNADSAAETPKEPPVLRDVASEPAPDRLVLTPAFRVNDDADDSPAMPPLQTPPTFHAPVEEEDATEDTTPVEMFWNDDPAAPPAMASPTSDRASLEATIAELEAAVTEAPDEWEPDGSEDLEDVAESSVTSAFLQKLDARQNARTPEETVTDAVTDHVAETIAEEIAEAIQFEEVAFKKADPADVIETADDGELDPTDDQAPHAVALDDDAFGSDDPVHETIAEIVEPEPVEEPTFSHSRFEEVYDPVAEATADAAEQEPGDVYGDELAPDDDPAFGPVGAPAAGGQLVDPDALRAMVGEMIREELQGEMGERITRNVRKLVRREINRVIAEQDI